MTIAGPDIDGFRDAQNRLRSLMGADVDFKIPQAPVYAGGVALDDDGTPYDPTIQPVSGGGMNTVTKRVGLIVKPESPLRPGADSRFAAGGEFSGMDAILDLNATDYAAVQNAVEAWVFGKHFKIEEWKPFGLTRLDRYSVYLQEK